MKLQIDDIQKVVLLGGGALLRKICLWCLSEDASVSVITSPRHSNENLGPGYIDGDELSLREFLERNHIPFIIAEDIQSERVEQFLGDTSDAFCVSLGAAWIFKEPTINSLFKGRLFNLHGTRLPQNRGGGGFSWQVMMGTRFGFCQLHLIDGCVDTGDIVKTREFLYPAQCRIPKDYEGVYLEKNLDFIIDFIEEIRQKGVCVETVKQSEYFSTYWPRLNTSLHGWIDWNTSLVDIERFVCAFDDPYEGAKSYLSDEIVFIKKVSVDYPDGNFHSFQSGIVYRKNENWLCVCVDKGSLIIESIVNHRGENLLPKIKPGDRLYTPQHKLDERTKRVIYTPSGSK